MCYMIRPAQEIIPAFEPCEHGAIIFLSDERLLCPICKKKWVIP